MNALMSMGLEQWMLCSMLPESIGLGALPLRMSVVKLATAGSQAIEPPVGDAQMTGETPEMLERMLNMRSDDYDRALERIEWLEAQLAAETMKRQQAEHERDCELEALAASETVLRECRNDLEWLRDNQKEHGTFTAKGFADRIAAIDAAMEKDHE